MSSGTEKFLVVFWKTGVSWQKWQRAENCSTRARLQLRMPVMCNQSGSKGKVGLIAKAIK